MAPWRGLVLLVKRPIETLACLLSALMVVVSFPRFDLYPFLFIAYVPLLAVVTRMRPRRAFFYGWLTGTVTVAFGFYFVRELLEVFGGMPGWVCLLLHLLFSLFQGIHVAAFSALASYLSGNRCPSATCGGSITPPPLQGCRSGPLCLGSPPSPFPSERTLATLTGAASLAGRVVDSGRRLPLTLVAPLTFVMVELVAREIYIFPYHMGSASYLFTPFIQVADLVGVLGLTALILLVNATLLLVGETVWKRLRSQPSGRWPWRSAVITSALLGFTLVYGFIRMDQVDERIAAADKLRVGLVEADIGIFMKANPQRVADNLLIHQNVSARLAEMGVDLIVWPETAVNLPFFAISTLDSDRIEDLESTLDLVGELPRDVTYIRPSRADLVEHVQQDRQQGTSNLDRAGVQRGFTTPLLFGVLTARDPTPEELPSIPTQGSRPPQVYYNTAVLIDSQGRVLGAYDKNVLLMFGEYVPLSHFLYRHFGFNFFEMVPSAGDVTPGEGVTVLELPLVSSNGSPRTVRIGAMICYEDIIADYGLELAELDPNVFINVINDGWFQTSSAAYHHMAFSVLRAVEHRLALVRSTNTGVSSFIDPAGRILSQTFLVGAATRIEDARHELMLSRRLGGDLALRLASLETDLKRIQADLIRSTEELDGACGRQGAGGCDGAVLEQVLAVLGAPVRTASGQLTASLGQMRGIRADLERSGLLQGDVAELMEGSQQLVEAVLSNLEEVALALSEAGNGATEWVGNGATEWAGGSARAFERLQSLGDTLDESQRMLSGPEYLVEDVPIMSPPRTVYSKVGDTFAYLASLGVLVMLVMTARARRRRKERMPDEEPETRNESAGA